MNGVAVNMEMIANIYIHFTTQHNAKTQDELISQISYYSIREQSISASSTHAQPLIPCLFQPMTDIGYWIDSSFEIQNYILFSWACHVHQRQWIIQTL